MSLQWELSNNIDRVFCPGKDVVLVLRIIEYKMNVCWIFLLFYPMPPSGRQSSSIEVKLINQSPIIWFLIYYDIELLNLYTKWTISTNTNK